MATQIERKIEITYRWWEVDSLEIEDKHISLLDKKAEVFIPQQLNKGYTSGELPTQNFPSTDCMYTGYWEKTTTKTS